MNAHDRLAKRKANLVKTFEKRRKALGISRRKLSEEAGLEQSYYQHFVADGFGFPTEPKLNAIESTLTRLEKVAEFSRKLTQNTELENE